METYLLDWANLLLRWLHVITAIALLLATLQSPDIGCRLLHLTTRLFLNLAGMPVSAVNSGQLPEITHLLLVNHCSYLDALVLYAALPANRHYAFVAKDDLARQPLFAPSCRDSAPSSWPVSRRQKACRKSSGSAVH